MTWWLDAALLVVTGAAVIVAGLSWRESRKARAAAEDSAAASQRSAAAAEDTARTDAAMLKIERVREHARTTPLIEGDWKPGPEEGNGRVVFTSRADRRLHLDLVRLHMGPQSGLRGFHAGGHLAPELHQMEDLHPSVPVEIWTAPTVEHGALVVGGRAVLTLQVRDDDERTWTIPVEIEIPRTPRIY